MDDNGCIYTGRKWFCPTDCDDPSHGRSGPARILDSGRYWRPGDLISITEL